MIYYGDELLVHGNDEIAGRAPMPWDTLETESTADPDAPELTTWRRTRQLMCVRRAYSALRTGSFVTLGVDDGARAYAYGRFDASITIAVAINADGQPHDVSLRAKLLDIPDGTLVADVLSDDDTARYTVSDGHVTVSLAPYSGVLLIPADEADAALACRHLAPVADAGSDQSGDPETVFSLDGTASYHPDYRPLVAYRWYDETGSLVATEAQTEVGPLPIGSHAYTLEVEDDLGYTGSDDVLIEVVACGPAEISASSRRGLALVMAFGFAPMGWRTRRRRGRR